MKYEKIARESEYLSLFFQLKILKNFICFKMHTAKLNSLVFAHTNVLHCLRSKSVQNAKIKSFD